MLEDFCQCEKNPQGTRDYCTSFLTFFLGTRLDQFGCDHSHVRNSLHLFYNETVNYFYFLWFFGTIGSGIIRTKFILIKCFDVHNIMIVLPFTSCETLYLFFCCHGILIEREMKFHSCRQN